VLTNLKNASCIAHSSTRFHRWGLGAQIYIESLSPINPILPSRGTTYFYVKLTKDNFASLSLAAMLVLTWIPSRHAVRVRYDAVSWDGLTHTVPGLYHVVLMHWKGYVHFLPNSPWFVEEILNYFSNTYPCLVIIKWYRLENDLFVSLCTFCVAKNNRKTKLFVRNAFILTFGNRVSVSFDLCRFYKIIYCPHFLNYSTKLHQKLIQNSRRGTAHICPKKMDSDINLVWVSRGWKSSRNNTKNATKGENGHAKCKQSGRMLSRETQVKQGNI